MAQKRNKKMVSITLSQEEVNQLAVLSEKLETNKSALVGMLITNKFSKEGSEKNA